MVDEAKPLSETSIFEKIGIPEESLKKARSILKRLNLRNRD
jgi:hypothetical protein